MPAVDKRQTAAHQLMGYQWDATIATQHTLRKYDWGKGYQKITKAGQQYIGYEIKWINNNNKNVW